MPQVVRQAPKASSQTQQLGFGSMTVLATCCISTASCITGCQAEQSKHTKRYIHTYDDMLMVCLSTLIHLMAVMRVNSSWLEAFSTRIDASATQSTVGVACRIVRVSVHTAPAASRYQLSERWNTQQANHQLQRCGITHICPHTPQSSLMSLPQANIALVCPASS
jgi:hypothetical protein